MELWNRLKSEMEMKVLSDHGEKQFEALREAIPALQGFTAAAQVIAFQIDRSNEKFTIRDGVLCGLIRTAQTADELGVFARALLFLCVGDVLGCTCKHYSPHFANDGEAVSEVFSRFISEIESWPLGRTAHIAATFTLNVRRKVKAGLNGAQREEIQLRNLLQTVSDDSEEAPTMTDFWARMASPPSPMPSEAEIVRRLTSVCRMSRTNARLCAEKVLHKINLREAAEEIGISHSAARQRWRTVINQLQQFIFKNDPHTFGGSAHS